MTAAAQAAGVLFGVAQNFRYNRSLEWMREQIAAGRIGSRSLLTRSTLIRRRRRRENGSPIQLWHVADLLPMSESIASMRFVLCSVRM